MGNTTIVLSSLVIGGVIMILMEKFYFKSHVTKEIDVRNISYSKCLMIGLFQAIAVVPGVSRSAATIIGGMALGISRKTIVEFSFLLAVPTIMAASILDIYKNFGSFQSEDFSALSIGFLASFISAIFAIKFLIAYVRKHDFVMFGVYRIALVLCF